MSAIRHIVLAGTDIWITEINAADGDTRRARELAAVSRLLKTAVPAEDALLHRDDGAPYLGNHPELFVSVTHSMHHAALSVARHPHGIDIEDLRPRLRDVAKRFVNEHDRVDTASLSGLLSAWTAKEAVFKAASSKCKGLMLWDICLEAPDRATIPSRGTELFRIVSQQLTDDTLLTLALAGF